MIPRRRWYLAVALLCLCTCFAAPAWADGNNEHGFLDRLGHLHPALVHFPIALVVVAALAEILGARNHAESYAFAARFMLFVAAFISVAAAALGFVAAVGQSYEGRQAINFTFHRVLGVVTPVMIFLALGLCESARRTGEGWQKTAYQAILFITVIVVLMAAYLGGTLVFGADAFF